MGDGFVGWLEGVARYGFGKLNGGPVYDQALMKVVDLFGYVRETNYGRQFEVRTEIQPMIGTSVRIPNEKPSQARKAASLNNGRSPMQSLMPLIIWQCSTKHRHSRQRRKVA